MMGPRKYCRILFIFGYVILASFTNCVESNSHARHGNRIKRFLFNMVEGRNSPATLCCTCNDFNTSSTCYDKCRGRRGSDICNGALCSTTATLLNGRFYVISRCESEDTCSKERANYEQTPGCISLNKTDLGNGTKCGYCCQSRAGIDGTYECADNLDKMMEHVYKQNTDLTDVREKTTTPDSCQGNACRIPSSPKETTVCKSALSTPHKWDEYIKKQCSSNATYAGNYSNYFSFKYDPTCFIECDRSGHGFLKPCSPGTAWSEQKRTCVSTGSGISKQTTQRISTLWKTTLPTMTTKALSSPSLTQWSSSSPSSSSLQSRSVSISGSPSSSSTEPVATATPVLVSINNSAARTKLTENHLSTISTVGKNEVTCDTCTNDTNCHVTKCSIDETYCLNVVIIKNGQQAIQKKSCVNLFECKYDHSSRNSLCNLDGTSSSITTNTSYTCQYCCQATNKPVACNADTIPKTIKWFEDKFSSPVPKSEPTTESSNHIPTTSETPSSNNLNSSPKPSRNSTVAYSNTSVTIWTTSPNSSISQFLRTTTIAKAVTTTKPPPYTIPSLTNTSLSPVPTLEPTSESSNHIPTTPETSSPFNLNSSNVQPFHNFTTTPSVTSTKPSRNSTVAYPNTSVTMSTTSPNSSLSKTLRTTTFAKVLTTTKPPPYTIPAITTKCKVCSGPDFLCEKLFVEKDCNPPNNYCINTISNKKDGSRLVNRRCDNFRTCYRDWFLGSSDNDKCRQFDENQVLTLQFTCTFCCIKDNCNLHLRPSDATLYKDL